MWAKNGLNDRENNKIFIVKKNEEKKSQNKRKMEEWRNCKVKI